MKNNIWFSKETYDKIIKFEKQKEQEFYNYLANGAKNEYEFSTLHLLNEKLKIMFEIFDGCDYKNEMIQNDFTIQLNGILHSYFKFEIKNEKEKII